MAVDWLIRYFIGYATGPSIPGFSANDPPVHPSTYLIPYDAACMLS